MDEQMLAYVKLTLRMKTDAYDDELSNLISSALLDLGIAGVVLPETLDAILKQTVATYVKMNFGEVSDYDKLSAPRCFSGKLFTMSILSRRDGRRMRSMTS